MDYQETQSNQLIKNEIKISYEKFLENINKLQSFKDCSEAGSICLESLEHVKFLRNSCVEGSEIQQYVATLANLLPVIKKIIDEKDDIFSKFSNSKEFFELKRMCWQLIGNICVQNTTTQTLIWNEIGPVLIPSPEQNFNIINIQLMILYNMFRCGNLTSFDNQILEMLLKILDRDIKENNMSKKTEFLHIFLEHLITNYGRIIALYGPLNDEQHILFLYYIADYIRENLTKTTSVNSSLMNYLSKEFKKKSDCILKTVDSYVNTIQPREVIALLEIICLASGSEEYSSVYFNDHSLFLNIGGLLKTITEIGKTPGNIFTPMQKLDEVAPNSQIPTDFEKEISFELKTMLIRTLANLLHRNKKNQEYVREMGIITAILDCTNVDARNPLIRQWSVYAIWNLCENCPKNQALISQLTKVGDAPNDVLKELDFNFGSLRIQPKKK